MHTAAFLVACLACVGDGRRVQNRPLEAESNSQQGLAALLLGLQPEAATVGLEDSKPGRVPTGSPFVGARSQVEPARRLSSSSSDHQWQDSQRQLSQLMADFARLRGGQWGQDYDEEDEEDEEERYRPELVRASKEERPQRGSNQFNWATGDKDDEDDDDEDYDDDGVQFVITTQMRLQLAQLGYRPSEVAALDPERAAAIIQRRIMRPASGVPSSWTRSYGGRALSSRRADMFKKIVLPGALILTATGVIKVGPLSDAVDAILRALSNPFGHDEYASKPKKKKTQKKKKRRSDDGPDLDPNDTWLDQQIDRLIYALQGKR